MNTRAGYALILLLTACCRGGAASESFDMQEFINREVAAGSKRIVIPPGRYRVTPEDRQHLVLKDLEGIEIVADGVEMVCTETTRALTIEACRNVTVRGLTIDYDPLPFTQGRIVSLSEDKLMHDIELFDGYPSAAKVQRAKYEIFRPDTRTLRSETYHSFEVEALGPRRIRVTKASHYRRHQDEQVGDLIVIAAEHAPGGSAAHSVYSNQCVNLRLERITLYASNCFGFLETHCDGTTYQRCIIDRRPAATEPEKRASARIRSLNADAFHSKHAVKGPAILECTARFQGDDCVNICGDYHMVMEARGRTLRVVAKRTLDIEPGDPVELLTYEGRRLPDARAVAVEKAGTSNEAEKQFLSRQRMDEGLRKMLHGHLTRAFTITLDRKVVLPMGSLIASTRSMGNGFAVKDCTFGPNRSRGILIKASDGEVSGNTLSGNWGEAIKVAPEYWWLESGSSSNVAVRDNVISGCRDIAIAVYAFGGARNVAPVGAHRNITLTGNRIKGSPLPNILVTSTTGLRVAGNACDPSREPAGASRSFGLDPEKLEPIMFVNTEKLRDE